MDEALAIKIEEPKKAKWPEAIAKTFRKRIKNLRKLQNNPVLYKAACTHYASHIDDFINDWMITHDPRVKPSFLPFTLWPKQREYIQWLWKLYQMGEDGHCEKSRDAGATWLNMGFSVGLWLFHDAVKIGFGSRKQDLVDRIGDPDSIFEKGRTIIRNLPHIFLPRGFIESRHLSFLKFLNPENGSTIAGEAGDNIGRGGRSSIYFKDESAHYERPMLIEASLSQNSDVKIDISTPCGTNNPFYKKRMSFPKHRRFVFDWRDDPRKNQEWYDKQERELDPVVLAQEVDRDYEASAEGICIPSKWVRAAIGFKLSDEGLYFVGYDVADEGQGTGKHAYTLRKGLVTKKCKDWRKGTTTEATREVVAICREHNNAELRFDSIGVGAGARATVKDMNYVKAFAINSAKPPVDGVYENTNIKNVDMFLNLRAQMWWIVRRRFEKTYEVVKGIKNWPEEELISIMYDPELVMELSTPKYFRTTSGKIKIQAKEDMDASPNKADSFVMCYAPVIYKSAGALR